MTVVKTWSRAEVHSLRRGRLDSLAYEVGIKNPQSSLVPDLRKMICASLKRQGRLIDP